MRPTRELAALVLMTLGLGLAAESAAAQPSSATTAKAEGMYKEAVALMDKGDYGAACPKLEEVIRLVPEGIGAKVTLAECYEESGRLASAWAAFGVAAEAAAKAGQAERQKKASDRRQALEPKLAKLTIQVTESARALEGLSITRDGERVPPSAWNVAVPVDKGRHMVVATSGMYRFEEEVEVEADGSMVSISIDGPAPRVSGPAPPPPDGDAPPDQPSGGFGAQRAAGLAVAGAGLVGLGVGVFFGVRAIDRKNQSNENGHCRDGNRCDQEGVRLRDEGLTAATVSTVMFIAGGVLSAGGAVLFFTAPSGDKGNAPSAAGLAIGPGSVAIRGSW